MLIAFLAEIQLSHSQTGDCYLHLAEETLETCIK